MMELVGQTPEDLIERLARLGKKDREAILELLSPEQRQLVERAMAAAELARAEELERQQRIDRQYLGYSPWLASLVEACDGAPPSRITSTAAKAVWDIHSKAVASRAPALRSGWNGLFDRLADIVGTSRKAGE